MNINDARALIEKVDTNHIIKNRVFLGMQILARYDDDIDIGTGHDIIYVSNFDETVEKMTAEEVERMAVLGWFESEESWAKFV